MNADPRSTTHAPPRRRRVHRAHPVGHRAQHLLRGPRRRGTRQHRASSEDCRTGIARRRGLVPLAGTPRRGGMRRFVVVALGVVAGFAAGCTGSPAPPPKTSTTGTSAAPVAKSAPKKVDPNSIKAKDAFGDFTTVAPCTALDLGNLPGSFRKYRTPTVVWSEDIDQCSVSVAGANGGSVQID